MKHLSDLELALLAGGDAGTLRSLPMQRHVRSCPNCQEKVESFRSLREDVADSGMPDLNWSSLAAEMRANIRLGLEAGECVRETRRFTLKFPSNRSFAFAGGFACLLVLAGASFFSRPTRIPSRTYPTISAQPGSISGGSLPSLESNKAGVALRSGDSSFTLLNHEGAVANQTVSAQGAVRSRFVDAGTVTINNVYLE